MSDAFADRVRSPSDPATTIFEISPSDTTDLVAVTTAVNVAKSGTLRITTPEGTASDVFVSAGHVFPIRARRVWTTGTSATGIRGLA